MPTIIAFLIVKSLIFISIMTLTIIFILLNSIIRRNVEECLNKIELLPYFEILNVKRLERNSILNEFFIKRTQIYYFLLFYNFFLVLFMYFIDELKIKHELIILLIELIYITGYFIDYLISYQQIERDYARIYKYNIIVKDFNEESLYYRTHLKNLKNI